MRLIIGNVRSPANPLLRAVSLVLGAVLLVAALVFGAVLVAFAVGVVIILLAVAYVRAWWIGRKIRKASGGAAPGDVFGGDAFTDARFARARRRTGEDGRIIEGEYTDVSDSDTDGR